MTLQQFHKLSNPSKYAIMGVIVLLGGLVFTVNLALQRQEGRGRAETIWYCTGVTCSTNPDYGGGTTYYPYYPTPTSSYYWYPTATPTTRYYYPTNTPTPRPATPTPTRTPTPKPPTATPTSNLTGTEEDPAIINASGPVYYYHSGFTNDYFYTKVRNDAGIGGYGYSYMGIAFNSCTNSSTGAKAIYRMYNPTFNTRHLSVGINQTFASTGWNVENNGKPIFYACNTTAPAVPVYQLIKDENAKESYYYTTNSAEVNTMVGEGWVAQGTAFYALLAPGATATPAPTTTTPTPTPTTVALTNTPVPTNTPIPTNTPVPGATKFALNLLLHGIGKGGDSVNANGTGNFNLTRPQRNASIEVYDSNNQLVLSKQGQVNFDNGTGSFKGVVDMGTALANGVYIIKVKLPQYLRTNVPGIQTIVSGSTNQIPTTTFITGDINGDNTINILDYNVLMGCYSDFLPPVSCNDTDQPLADLTDDGEVNQFDYNLFLRELTSRGGQ